MGLQGIEEALLLSYADTEVTTLGLSGRPQERRGQSGKQYWKRNTRGSTSSAHQQNREMNVGGHYLLSVNLQYITSYLYALFS